ncbi:MAG: hypothetical protein K6E50_13980 [Lachnospiraceae bacterium]|nr:hypothetical protein [Lachnospiraceae bacterium]
MIMPGDNVEFLDEGENGYMHVKFNDRKGYIISSVVEDMSSAGRNASALPMREVALTDGMVEGSQTITTSASAAIKKAPQKQAPQLSYQINVKTNLRDLPEESDNLLATLPAGTSVMLLGQKGDYAMVQYDGMTGYVLGSSVVNSLDYAKEHGSAVLFTLTGYCSCHICCGQYSPEITGGEAHTATGTVPQEGRTIAVDPRVIPYGSRVTIEGWGTYVAEDCGGGVKGNHIDMYFSTHEAARQFGRQQLYVTFEK